MKLADVLTSLRDLLGKPSKQIVAIVLNESGRACLNYDDFMNFEHIYPEGVDVIQFLRIPNTKFTPELYVYEGLFADLGN